MFDAALRRRIAPGLDRVAQRVASAGVRPGAITAAGWALGAGACAAGALRLWGAALVLWLANRGLDGLDGPLARATGGASDRGGYLDVVADFSIYGGIVVAVAIAVPDARLACAVLLFAFYVSGTALLTLSSLLERRRQNDLDERSVRLTGGLAEGFETIVVFTLFCLLPRHAQLIAWLFAAAVAVTAIQRVIEGAKLLADRSLEFRSGVGGRGQRSAAGSPEQAGVSQVSPYPRGNGNGDA